MADPSSVLGVVGEVPTQLVGGLLQGADAAQSVVDGLLATRRWISDRHNWARVGWFAGGLVMVLVAVRVFIEPVADAQVAKVAGVAAKVAK